MYTIECGQHVIEIDALEDQCPECEGEVACEGEEWRCVEHVGIHVGCGWHGEEPDCKEDEEVALLVALDALSQIMQIENYSLGKITVVKIEEREFFFNTQNLLDQMKQNSNLRIF